MPILRPSAPVPILAGDGMLFDDRLATVLSHAAQSEVGARTQYRQLLDLLGSMPTDAAGELIEAAYDRLGELAETLPQAVQSAILREPGLRLRNRMLVAWLARGEPQAAAAAMATAQLGESDWLYLIPRLPMTARGFLRHRRDLPFSARQVLDRLGVRDLVLPEPEVPGALFPAPSERKSRTGERPEGEAGIGALVRRIEAFQRARREGGNAPRLPLEETRSIDPEPARHGQAFDFAADAEGVVNWADPAMAPLAVGLQLGPPRPGAVAMLEESGARALAGRLPLRGVRATFAGPGEIAGEWRIDAAPVFAPATGQFEGYQGRLRRPVPTAVPQPAERSADRMRQLLHELRTPLNAIQGFAELIQQQMFGTAPHEYRALAAAVAVDAARVMAGFDEIDRLARLEIGVLRLDEGECDLREVVGRTLRRLDGVLRPRSARIELTAKGSRFAVGMTEADAMQLGWRLLATLAGALAPGEIVDLTLASDGKQITLDVDLPAAFAGNGDPFAASAPAHSRAISAGMFGTGFALRLARAEAEAIGGTLVQEEDRLRLVLPVLTASRGVHTQVREGNDGR
jgi:two-component system OmpR family sensor kinase